MPGAAYLVGSSKQPQDHEVGPSPISKLAVNGFTSEESTESVFQKQFAFHVFVAVVVMQAVALMGWREIIPVIIHAVFLFLLGIGTYVAYIVSKDHKSFRISIMLSGVIYAILHFFTHMCYPVQRSGGRVFALLLPTLAFHVEMGGSRITQVAVGSLHLVVYLSASIVEWSTTNTCWGDKADAAFVDNIPILTLVEVIIPCIMICFLTAFTASRRSLILERDARSEEFAKSALRCLVRQDYNAMAELVNNFDRETENPSMRDEALMNACEHVNKLRELVPGHLRSAADHDSPVSQIVRSHSVPNLNVGTEPPKRGDPPVTNAGNSPVDRRNLDQNDHPAQTIVFAPVQEFTDDGSSEDDDIDKKLKEKNTTNLAHPSTPSIERSPISDTDPFAPRHSPNPENSPSTQGITKSRSKAGISFLQSGDNTQINMETPAPQTLRRRSSMRGSTEHLLQTMTYEPSFIVVFSLPRMTNYATRSVANIDLMKMVFTEFADNVRKATKKYEGVTLWHTFTTIYAKLPDINSACCAGLALLELMKRESKHYKDHVLLETRAHMPFVIVLHAHLLSGIVGTEPSAMASMGASPADKVVAQIMERVAGETMSQPCVVTPVTLLNAVEPEFQTSESPHPALIVVEHALNCDAEGFPICKTKAPFVNIERTEIIDLEQTARDLAHNLISQAPKHAANHHTPSFHEERQDDDTMAHSVSQGLSRGERDRKRRLPPEVLDVWNRFDADRSGYLDVDEVRDVLEDMGITMTDSELKLFFDSVDSDHSGTVSLDEFAKSFFSATLGGSNVMSTIRRAATAMARNTGTDNLPIVLNAWKKYDADGSGSLEAQELFLLLQDLNMPTTEEEVQWLVEYMDKNGNGAIEFDEFAALFSEDNTANLRLNAVRERIQTVTRVMANKASGKIYSNDDQSARDKLVHLQEIVDSYFVFPLFAYIVYNFGQTLLRVAMGPLEAVSTPHMIVDLVLDFSIYGVWFFLKLAFLPREVGGQIIWKRREVLSAAMRSPEFWVDLLAILPLDFIYIALGSGKDWSPPTNVLNGTIFNNYTGATEFYDPATNGTVFWALGDHISANARGVLGYYRLNKLLTMYHFDERFFILTRHVDPPLARVANALCYFLLLSHAFACALILVARDLGSFEVFDMVGVTDLLENRPTLYLKSLYWAILTMAGQLKGEAIPSHDKELYLATAGCLIGLPMFTVILGTIGNAVNVEDSEARFLAKLDTLRGYFSYTNMPLAMEQECVGYYRHLFNTTGTLDINDNPLEELPVELSVQVVIEIGTKMLEKVPIFKEACTNLEFVHELTSKLVPRVLEPATIVMKKGERGTNMYFLTYGECEVLTAPVGGFCVFTFKQGAFFGEIALLHNVKRTATIGVGKKRYANVLTLDKKQFDEVAETFPQAFSSIYKAAEERIKQVLEAEAKEAKAAKEARKKERQEKRRKEREDRGEIGTDTDEESSDDEPEPAVELEGPGIAKKPDISKLMSNRPASRQIGVRPPSRAQSVNKTTFPAKSSSMASLVSQSSSGSGSGGGQDSARKGTDSREQSVNSRPSHPQSPLSVLGQAQQRPSSSMSHTRFQPTAEEEANE